jgi:predicted ATPase/DNA-binding SARP family transcriptional activator
MGAGTKFGILGPVEVWSGERSLALGGPRQLALLAFLVLHSNRSVSSDALIDAVWGTPGAGAGKRLTVAIARLRRSLQPLDRDGSSRLRTVSGGYLLEVGAGELDAERFEALVTEGLEALGAGEAGGAGERLRAALALWRGPALADVGFDDFAQSEIHRLEELRLLALEARIDADLQLGKHAGAVGELRSLTATHPTRERLACLLMLALYRSGRQADALDVYQQARAHLMDELGLEPGPATRALQAQILEQSPALDRGFAPARAPAQGRPTLGGAVTIVVAQIGDPASLVEGVGDLYHDLASGLNELLRRVWTSHRALEVAPRHDGSLAVFESPQDALDAALEVRDGAAEVAWHGGADVRLQIGVHTGLLRISSGGFWGEDVHYVARLADAAHGGQVLVSASTAAIAPEAPLVDLGEHRIGGFAIPRRLFGLGPGPHRLPLTGDPLRTNLPAVDGELIGRDRERAELMTALRADERRLITITGPGGSGKTCLALAVAEAIVDVLADGAFLVTLAQIGEPAAVAAAIAAPLGIHLQAGADHGDAIAAALSDRELLLVLDNFEHVLDAAPLLTQVLARAPRLRVIVTSQAPLRLRGERVLALGPLELPAAEDRTSVAAAAATRLLMERAREADPRFELTSANAGSLARLSRALSGLPLALELAAARLALLSPDQLLARLDDGIDAVGQGSRDLPARQRGLRAALDWTHALLDEDQAMLLRRLGAFAGPVSLDRIERVCGGGADLLEALAQLVDLSLVTRAGDGRFLLHAAVRQYARDKLVAAGERVELARCHGEAFAEAAEAWGSRILFDVGAVESAVLREEADIGQALSWAAEADQECFARLAGGAAMALLFTARLSPWSDLIERALDGNSLSGRPRAWLLLAASLAAFQREDVAFARARLASTVIAAEQAGDPWLACLMRACSLIFEVLAGATDGLREAHTFLSERVLRLRDRELIALVDGLEPYILGYCEGRHAEAGAIWAALAEDRRRTDFAGWTALYCWPDCRLLIGDHAAALDGYRAALRSARERVQSPTVAYQLEGIAMSLSGLGRHEEALEAAGWAGSVRQTAGPAVNSWYKELLGGALRRSRAALDARAAAAAYTKGRSLTLDAAVNAALGSEQLQAGSPLSRGECGGSLWQ